MKIPYPRVLIDGTLYLFTPKRFIKYLERIIDAGDVLHPMDHGATVSDVVNFSITSAKDAEEILNYIRTKIQEEADARVSRKEERSDHPEEFGTVPPAGDDAGAGGEGAGDAESGVEPESEPGDPDPPATGDQPPV